MQYDQDRPPPPARAHEVERGRESAVVVGVAVAQEDRLRAVEPEIADVVAQDVPAEPAVEERGGRRPPAPHLHQEREPVRAEGSGGAPGLEHVAEAVHGPPAPLGAGGEVAGQRQHLPGGVVQRELTGPPGCGRIRQRSWRRHEP